MVEYGIFDESGNVVGEFETLEAGIAALAAMEDGEVQPYEHGAVGYYTEHYHLERGLYARVCKGKTALKFKDGAPIAPLSATELGLILSGQPCDELETVLETLDTEKARSLFDGFAPPPIVWNAESRTMVVTFYYLETEDTSDGDVALYYKCAPFMSLI